MRQNRRRGLAILCGLALAGCSGVDQPNRAADSPPPSAAVSATGTAHAGPACAHDLGGTAPSDPHRLVLDAVVLPTTTLVPQESGEPDWLFAKHGLVVRAGTSVEITVAPEVADRVRIGWGSPGPEGTTIHVPACQSASGWLAFAGGYTVRSATCVPLIVRANGRQERVGVSVGAAC
jgi:hypothetical protein